MNLLFDVTISQQNTNIYLFMNIKIRENKIKFNEKN
jgi:hypothetical protein